MLSLATLFAVAAGLASIAVPAQAADWHFLTYYPSQGEKFTRFSGEMVAPTLPKAGYYYLWPGLQDEAHTGVFQPVLDGKSGAWWFSPGWCCGNPSLSWGGGVSVGNGDKLSFDMALDANGTAYNANVGNERSGSSATNSLPLADKVFNQAVFAIELTGVAWDFGPLVFKNVVIESTGTDSGWCNSSPSNYNGATNYTISGVSATKADNKIICSIDSVILQNPI
ncbi:hypothetical protein I317_06478 [Kwoniella heveanensis CBS 569]|uniref:Uncharacterized protein n=1 Tax=Kwoniella heveanensis BCC8398 TaxID=1296120 RepID=A0A1B9GM91_9TREE|nr:hypothetical protein I316_06153 [Kwoniella heveanensis BCC8398]OCF39753.1 hypothetical protein I317_06478 [Kwoniella heveanensis CBS 569]